MFEKCEGLRKVEFLEGTEVLGKDEKYFDVWSKLFRDSRVKEVVLPSTLREMHPDMFKDCSALKIVWVAKGCPLNVKSFVGSGVEVSWK